MNPAVKEELGKLRDLINITDGKIVGLLAERQRLILRVGELKLGNNLPVFDSAREQSLLDSLASLCQKEGLSAELVTSIYGLILDKSKADQAALIAQNTLKPTGTQSKIESD